MKNKMTPTRRIPRNKTIRRFKSPEARTLAHMAQRLRAEPTKLSMTTQRLQTDYALATPNTKLITKHNDMMKQSTALDSATTLATELDRQEERKAPQC